jgi:predicted GNAT family N-acyltransferase
LDVRFVCHGSSEWSEAREIRDSVFFRPHELPTAVLDDEYEADATHLVAVDDGRVVGYGRLCELGGGEYRISQIVVLPALQRHGIGTVILQHLVREAESAGAASVQLDARLAAVDFYSRAGFRQHGPVFPSPKTGLPHVRMEYLPTSTST